MFWCSRLAALAVAIVCVLGFAQREARAEVNADELAKLKGNWNLVTTDNGNGAGPRADTHKGSLLIDGDKITPMREGKPEEKNHDGSPWQWQIISIESAGDHNNIDFKWTIDKKEVTLHGIYRVKGDDLEMCFDVEGGPRATEFKPGKNTGVFVLKRGPVPQPTPSTQPTTRKSE